MRAVLPRLTERKMVPIALFLFAGVFALRLLALARLAESELLLPASGDMQFYNAWALRILRGAWTDHLAFYGLPLYAYLLAVIYKICGYTPFIPGFLQAVLDAGTAMVLYQLSRLLFATPVSESKLPEEAPRGEVIGVLAALGWAFFQPAQSYSIILMPTAWLVFIFWFIAWQIVRPRHTPRLWVLFSLGTLMGFAAMGVATILFLAPLVLAAILFRWPATGARRVVGAMLLAAGILIGASPAWIHNCFVARDPVFLSAHSGINLWIGNNPVATGYPKFPPGLHAEQQALLTDSIGVAEHASGHTLRRSEVSSYWSTQAMRWIRGHPLAWVKLISKKIKNFWNAYQYDDLSVIGELREQSIIMPGIGFGVVAALAIPGILIACWKLRDSRWIAAAVFLHMVSVLTVFVTERYRLVAIPGLLLFAGFGLWELWRRIVRTHYLEASLYLLLLVSSTAFVSLPQKDETLWALDAYNSGVKALEAGRLPEARRKLDLAYAYSPFNAGVNFAEGNLHFAIGDMATAQQFYRATLRLDPHHPGAWNNLGVLALQEERWELAVEFFMRALEQNGISAKTFYLMAEAQFRAGNLLAADSAIVQALELNPNRSEFRILAERIASASNTPPLP